jgi:hypothetical protein
VFESAGRFRQGTAATLLACPVATTGVLAFDARLFRLHEKRLEEDFPDHAAH